MLGQMKRQLENSRCFRQGMEKDLEECAEARWLAKPVLDSRALPLDSDNVRLQGPGVMSFEKKHTISGKGSIKAGCAYGWLPQTSQQPRIFGHDHDAPAPWRKFGEV